MARTDRVIPQTYTDATLGSLPANLPRHWVDTHADQTEYAEKFAVFLCGPTTDELVTTDGQGNLNVNVGGTSITLTAGLGDNHTFTEGTTNFAPVGGEYNSAPTAPTSGRGAAARVTKNRALLVSQGGASFARIAANTAGVAILAAPGELHRVIINTKGATGNVLTLYDNASAASGTVIAIIDTTDSTPRQYDVHVSNGIFAVLATGSAADLTICFEA